MTLTGITRSADLRFKSSGLRDWAALARPKLTASDLEQVYVPASLEGSEAAFRTYFIGAAFQPIAKLSNDRLDGWRLEFDDILCGAVYIRVKPVFEGETHDYSLLEVRVPNQMWREFRTRWELSLLLDIFAPCPF